MLHLSFYKNGFYDINAHITFVISLFSYWQDIFLIH